MPGQRSFLLLHGFGNHRPPEHWQHWLHGRLEAAGERVIYPQLPDPDNPTLADWRAALDAHLDALAQTASAERIVLCHSLSCLLWLHAAAGIGPERRPDRLVLVSPPASAQVPEPAVGFGLETVDGALAAALATSVRGEIRIVGSDHDPYNPGGVDAVYARPLGVAFDVVPGGGHISAGDGYGPWPAILSWCLAPGGPVGAPATAAPVS